jgi:hypothetical protein
MGDREVTVATDQIFISTSTAFTLELSYTLFQTAEMVGQAVLGRMAGPEVLVGEAERAVWVAKVVAGTDLAGAETVAEVEMQGEAAMVGVVARAETPEAVETSRSTIAMAFNFLSTP